MSEEDTIIGWALRLAEAVVPNEVELAPSMVTAYVAGGTRRDEMFQRARSVPAGFGADVALVMFPHVLAAIAAAGHSLWKLFGGNASTVPTLLKNLDLWDRRKRHPDEPGAAPPDHLDLGPLIDTIDEQLTASGIEPLESELLTLRIMRTLIANSAGTRAFLAATTPTSTRKHPT